MSYLTDYIFVPLEIAQLVSTLLTCRRIRLRKSHLGVLLDLAIYTFVSCLAKTVASLLYLLQLAQEQYVARYPLYSSMPLLFLVSLIGIGSLFYSTMLLHQMLIWRNKETEWSLVCRTTLIGLFGTLAYVLFLYFHRMATINLLDIADYLSFVSALTWACRIIPQVSVNWFYDTFNVLHKYFLHLEILGCLWVLASYWLLGKTGLRWYEMPLNAPLKFLAMVNLSACILLVIEKKMYPSRSLAYHAIPKQEDQC